MAKHVAGSTVFAQNVMLWTESGYFDKAANLKPLLHLWSLAVEEQVYLFLPPVLMLVLRRKGLLVPVLGLLLVISFVTGLGLSTKAAGFFLTPFRTWEFLGGALLAWWHYGKGHEEEEPPFRQAVGTAGVVLLGLGLAFLNHEQPYPGWRALLPVAGSLLLIEAGRNAWPNRYLLGLRPVVWVGLISYPLYLFHWPALSFVHIVQGETPEPATVGIALGIAFGLAVITYYGLEKHLRYHPWRGTAPTLALVFVALGAVGLGVWKGRIPARPPTAKMKQVEAAVRDTHSSYENANAGRGMTSSRKDGIMIWHTGGDGPQTVFVGDSNCGQYFPRIHKSLREKQGNTRGATFVWTGAACPIPGVINRAYPNAKNLMPTFDKVIATNPAVDRVVYAALWQSILRSKDYSIDGVSFGEAEGRRRALDAWGRMISQWVASGKRVALVLPVPSGPGLDPSRIYPRSFLAAKGELATRMTEKTFYDWAGPMIADLELAARRAGAEVIDPRKWMVADGFCLSEDEEGPVRSDGYHLRANYVSRKVTYLDGMVEP